MEKLKNDILHNIQKIENERKELSKGKTCQTILNELLTQIEKVDYRSHAELEDGDKLCKRHYAVITIDEIFRMAEKYNWGLCTKDGFIYVFNGKYWQTIGAEDFKPFLADAALQMGVPIFDAKYHLFKDELYRQFLSSANLSTPEVKKNVSINLLNGTFDITEHKQELRAERKEDFIKYQLPFEFNPDADCPLFDTYLRRVLPDADCQKVVAEYLGYIFVNNLKLEKALILYGNGANGKSVFFEIVNAMLGEENICSYSLQNLTKIDGYQRAELANKLLNYASEISGKLETSIFKQLVSGEPVEVRQIYGKPFTMREYGKLIFNCNELPKEVEQTNAFFRRFLIIPFTQTIPEAEQDPELAKKIIAAELSGVFNWILDGLKRIIRQKRFTQADLVRNQLDAYKKESDSVALFLDEEGYSKAIEEYSVLKSLYVDYKEFCGENCYRVCSLKTFADRLRKQGYELEKKMQGLIIYLKK